MAAWPPGLEPMAAWPPGLEPMAAGRWPLAAGRWPLAAGRPARWPPGSLAARPPPLANS